MVSLKVPLYHLALRGRQRLVAALARPADLPNDVGAADARVNELRVAVWRIVHHRDTNAEDGDVQLPLDALVLPARMRHLKERRTVSEGNFSHS